MSEVQADPPEGTGDNHRTVLDMSVPTMKRIAIDFDGTLVEEKWPDLGDWLPGAVDALKELAEHFDEVVIFSCRLARMDTDEVTPRENYDQIIAMSLMLERAGIPDNVILWTKDYKPPAEHYIDNRAIRFNGDWEETIWNIQMEQGMKKARSLIVDRDPGDEQDAAERQGFFEASMRTFETGATRNTDDGKLDYEGFLSPVVLRRYAEYMHSHRIQSDGTMRSSDNWQKGIPRDAYMKSAFRHFMDWWGCHRGDAGGEDPDIEEAICALIFNASGYLHELLVR